MALNCAVQAYFIVILSFITRLMSTARKSKFLPSKLLTLDFFQRIRTDPLAIESASRDYGNIVHESPAAVLYPSSVKDIVGLIKFAYNYSAPLTVSARGRSHSVFGQAMAPNGVVIDMMSLRSHREKTGVLVGKIPSLGFYADVGGEQLWIDVLKATLEHGLAPVSWTDYLYLTVGGTLSNAGISGQSFRYGPQISNVYEMDVVTGMYYMRTPHIILAVFSFAIAIAIEYRSKIIKETRWWL